MKMKNTLPALCLIFISAMIPLTGINDYYMTIFCQAAIYSVVVLGLNFITGMTGQMNMGNAAVYGLGAYTMGLLTTRMGMSPWIALIFVALMGCLIGCLIGWPSLRVQGVYLSLTTIAFNEIVRLLLQNLQFTGGSSGVRNIPSFTLFGWEINTPSKNFYFLLVVLVLAAVVSQMIIRSKYGRAFIAVRDNVDAIESSGLNLTSIKMTAFMLSTVFGALAGGFYACFMGYISPSTYTTNLSTSFLVMLIVGGRGNVWGCIIGATIIAFAPEMLRFLGDYYKFIYALLVILIIVFNPNGLTSVYGRLREKLYAAKAHRVGQ